IRFARFSPTRVQYWIVPSTPAFSLMSRISATSATSSIRGPPCPVPRGYRRQDKRLLASPPSHEGLQEAPHLGPPLLLGPLRSDVPGLLTEAGDEAVEGGHPLLLLHELRRGPRLGEHELEDLLGRADADEAHEALPQELQDLHVPPELTRLLVLLHEEAAGQPLEFRGDLGGLPREVLLRERSDLEEVAEHGGGLQDAPDRGLHLRDLHRARGEHEEECLLPDPGDEHAADLVLLDAELHVLRAQLPADVDEVPLDEVQEPVLVRAELRGDARREDAAVHAHEEDHVE